MGRAVTRMDEYDQRALRASVMALGAAVLAYAATYVHRPGPDVAAVFGLGAVVSLAAYYMLGRPASLADRWLAPAGGAAVSLATTTIGEMRIAAIGLAAAGVVGTMAYPAGGTAVRLVVRATRQVAGAEE
ncbi:hypothetical protein KVP04_07975 [Halobacterium salinarum]|uniref:Uncharacterized protein n=5 Tax=Halobacterium salinarum TaxID=2242 RepID=Q9HN54_HALSA|nr:hypothetical protein VNG_2246H [Halobacterium salinarum NRC-1]MCF2164458.1 hypothetical protein [Halobacterium salinarum]MCF2167245.1 hypothetical protein [Halobacterium salinarum]MCF2239062.1 hypothetical protein [Halobacterium salinarum]QRY22417.1 hypothetical protein JT689_10410 [Halobacterium sp. GSL-19]